MEHLRINHASGYIDLYVDTFFPCPLQKARKVFRLINQWCPQEERQELMEYLLERAQAYEASIESNTQQLQLSLMPHMKKRGSPEGHSAEPQAPSQTSEEYGVFGGDVT